MKPLPKSQRDAPTIARRFNAGIPRPHVPSPEGTAESVEYMHPPDRPTRRAILRKPFTPIAFRAKLPLMSVQFQPPIPGTFVYHPERHDLQIGIITC